MNERLIFEKAIEIRDLAARTVFVEQACGGDQALRKRVDDLLASHDQASGFLKNPVVEQITPDVAESAQTVVVGKNGVPSPSEDDDDTLDTADLSFLQSSEKPGSIGRLGHYEILQVIGQGAFGIVFKAFDEKLHRYVAVKALSPQLAVTSPPRKRFLREARSVAAIRHENIVQIYSVEEQPIPYLAMEFVDGQTLQDKLNGAGPLEAPEILHLGRQMAAGLAAAHDKGLIHRDIKPGNILLESGAEQKVKITDFGLARAADDATMTRTGTIAGTPMYMAPEQAMGQDLDHRVDLFSLGSVLYQMTCGRAPFRGPNAIAVLKRVVDETPRPIRQILPEAPDWLCAIIEKLHAKNPDERYQTAKEVADLMARCQNELQVNGVVTCVQSRHLAPRDEPSTVRRGSPDPATVLHGSPDPTAVRRGSPDPDMVRRGSPDPAEIAHHGSMPQGDLRSVGSAGSGDPRTTKGEGAGSRDPRTTKGEGAGSRDPRTTKGEGAGAGDPRTTKELRTTSTQPSSTLQGSSRRSETATFVRPLLVAVFLVTVAIVGFMAVNRSKSNPDLASGELKPGDAASEISNSKSQISNPATGWAGWPADAPKPAIAPFSADEAKIYQEAWAKYLNVPVEYTNSIGMKFRLIPPGEFIMGSTAEEVEAAIKDVDQGWSHVLECIRSELPQHKVFLTRPVYLGVYEVTQSEYEKLSLINPSFYSSTGPGKEKVQGLETTRHPVENVSWNDVAEFCSVASKLEKLKPYSFNAGENVAELEGMGYRLPSEAEWEFACRAGTSTLYWTGDRNQELMTTAWMASNSSGRTHPCGELRANPFGLHDIHGNVWEWVQDSWEPDTYSQFADRPAFNPVAQSDSSLQRVARGGDSNIYASGCRSRGRGARELSNRSSYIGFRLSLGIDAVRYKLGVAGPATPKSSSGIGGSTGAGNEMTPNSSLSTNTPTKPVKEPTTERELAAWLLTKPGMTLNLRSKDGIPVNITTGGTLPTAVFTIYELTWREANGITDQDLARIGRAENLGSLSLSSLTADRLNITGKGLDALLSPTVTRSLTKLQLQSPTSLFTHDDYLKINRATELTMLVLAGIQTPDFGKTLAELRLRKLDDLSVVKSRFDGGCLMAVARNSPDLLGITLQGMQFTMEDTAALKRFDLLEILRMSVSELTDTDLAEIGSLPNLKLLDLSGNREITGDGIRAITSCIKLAELNLHDTNVTDAVCDTLQTLPELETLTLGATRLTDEGVQRLASLPKIQFLNIQDCKRLTDEGISTIAKMTDLKQLEIQNNPQLTEPAVRKLQAALPNCKIVSDFPDVAAIGFAAERKAAESMLQLGKGIVTIRDKDGQPLGELKSPLPEGPFSISTVSLERADVTNEDLAKLIGCQALEELDLTQNTRFTTDALAALGPQPQLRKIWIRSTRIGNDGLAWLANSPDLFDLDALDTPIDEQGWASLPPLRKLKWLVTPSKVGTAGVQRIAEQCPELQSLGLGDWSIRDLEALTRLPRFRALSTGPNGLSDPVIDSLLKMPVFEDLSINSPAVEDLQRLKRLAPKLRRFSFREQIAANKFTATEAWAPVLELPELVDLRIYDFVAVDAAALQRIAAIPKLERVVIGNDIAPELKSKFRNFNADDIAKFRESRPNVELHIDGQIYRPGDK